MPKLYRSTTNKKLCGVCAGLAEAYEWDVNIVRLALALLTFPTAGQIWIAYIIAYLLLPTKDGHAAADDVTRDIKHLWETEVKPHFDDKK